MNDTPTLPGTLPGLLQPGCPVIWLGEQCICIDAPNKDGFASVWVPSEALVETAHASGIALDLSRPEGVDRALRWYEEKRGLPKSALPPQLALLNTPLRPAWFLRPVEGDARFIGFADILDPIEALRLACLAVGEVSGG